MAFLKENKTMGIIKNIFGKKGNNYTSAIIVAAGSGSRMNCAENKQLIEINGTPVIAHTISAFQNAETVDEIVVVASEAILDTVKRIVTDYEFSKVTNVVVGGSTRQKSVLCGINAVNENTDYIAIHDGARPFTTSQLINLVNNTAYENNAAAPGIKVTSTVKVIDKNNFIKKTVDRDDLRLIQTPQTFNYKKYKTLLFSAMANNKEFTDDCQLFEDKNIKIAFVDGESTNIKITTDDDLIFANAITDKLFSSTEIEE